MLIEAYDSAYPNIRARTNLIVTVNRNLNGPDANSVSLTLPETTDPITWSYYINATDRDSVSMLTVILCTEGGRD